MIFFKKTRLTWLERLPGVPGDPIVHIFNSGLGQDEAGHLSAGPQVKVGEDGLGHGWYIFLVEVVKQDGGQRVSGCLDDGA